MSNPNAPTKCNHCQSKNVIHFHMGRTEFYSCGDCKQEVVKVPEIEYEWDPKIYGFGSMDFSISLPQGLTFEQFKKLNGIK